MRYLYTAITGGVDRLVPPERVPPGWRCVCFSDSEEARDDWEIRPASFEVPDPARASRVPKLLPHRFFPDAEVSLWIDGNVSVECNLDLLVDEYLDGSDIAFHRHDQRDCIYDEAIACIELEKDDPALIVDQVVGYALQGYARHSGLVWGGVILRRHTDEIARFNERWWDELVAGSRRDQLSAPFVLAELKVAHALFDSHVREGPLFGIRSHEERPERPVRSKAPVSRTPTSTRESERLGVARFLFVAGCPRSGTTALTTLLNQDEAILLGQERFRHMRGELRLEHFEPEVFFEPDRDGARWPRPPQELVFPGSTDDYKGLRARLQSGSVEVMGDKAPLYHENLAQLVSHFPNSRFIVLVRDLHEVAESFNRRARDPGDHWPVENDYRMAARLWRNALVNAKTFAEGDEGHRLYLLDYHAFYAGSERELTALYEFLGLRLPSDVANRYSGLTASPEAYCGRSPSTGATLSSDEDAYLEARRDPELTLWHRERCAAQRAGAVPSAGD